LGVVTGLLTCVRVGAGRAREAGFGAQIGSLPQDNEDSCPPFCVRH